MDARARVQTSMIDWNCPRNEQKTKSKLTFCLNWMVFLPFGWCLFLTFNFFILSHAPICASIHIEIMPVLSFPSSFLPHRSHSWRKLNVLLFICSTSIFYPMSKSHQTHQFTKCVNHVKMRNCMITSFSFAQMRKIRWSTNRRDEARAKKRAKMHVQSKVRKVARNKFFNHTHEFLVSGIFCGFPLSLSLFLHFFDFCVCNKYPDDSNNSGIRHPSQILCVGVCVLST